VAQWVARLTLNVDVVGSSSLVKYRQNQNQTDS